MTYVKKYRLGDCLVSALNGQLHDGWVFQPSSSELSVDSIVFLVDDEGDLECDEEDTPLICVQHGCIFEGLDLHAIESVVACARQFEDPPGEEMLFESYFYYWRNDAYLPEPGAPDPPIMSVSEGLLLEDVEYFENLAAEDPTSTCMHNGCTRGTTKFSSFCRIHHFENIRNRPCPLQCIELVDA